MGFDLYGQAPRSVAGESFRSSVWGWRPLQVLISITCADILTEVEERELGFNDGYAYSADKAEAIASRLGAIAADEKRLADYKRKVMALMREEYQDYWSKENIEEFVQFLKNSGGFFLS